MPYNPFDKPFGDPLTPDDLQKLVTRQVAEGYYVEYKGVVPANEKIGKSIASFANTYGGWYIVGVTTNAHNVATTVDGFDPASCHDPIAKVREVVKSHISPTPVFFAQVVTLSTSNLVLVVYVPEEQDTPFITQDGRIYRRAHDSSDPVPEKDRYALDRIVERGQKSRKAFARFCQDERTLSKGEAERSRWVSLYLWPYPYGVIEYKSGMDTEEAVEALLQRSQQPVELRLKDTDGSSITIGTGNVPFTAGQVTHRSILLRQVTPSRVGMQALSTELFFDGRARIFVSLADISPFNHEQVAEWVTSPRTRQILAEYMRQDREVTGITLGRFFDVQQLWATLALLMNFYRAWLGEVPGLSEIKIAMRLQGIWRSIPFLDADEWGAQVEKLGLPIVGSDRIIIPEDLEGIITSFDESLWLTICFTVGQALGFSRELLGHAMVKLAKNPETGA